MTELNVKKLSEAFAIDATIEQACDYADISIPTYHNWVKKNPKLLDTFDRMRQKLPLKAKENIALKIRGEEVKGDIPLSKWLLERSENKYVEKLKINQTTDDSNESYPEDEALRLEFKERLRQNIIKRIKAEQSK